MNEITEDAGNCPATVYGDSECTREATSEDLIGWMIWGKKKVVAIKLDNLWIPYVLSHKISRVYPPATRSAA